MAHNKIGSYEWSLATDGALNLKEKITLFGELVAAQVLNAVNAAGNKSGLNNSKIARVDASKIIIPDSKIAKETFEYVQELYDVSLYNHCLRTYLWGVLTAQYYNEKPDLEFLYVGSLLHDAGLTQENQPKICKCCFAVTGARQAKTFVEQKGWEISRSTALFNAISKHLNPLVSKEKDGVEAFLIKSGAYMDLLGFGHTRIPRAEKENIIYNYPRLNFSEEILNVEHFPNSRGAFFIKFGAGKLSKENPLNALEPLILK